MNGLETAVDGGFCVVDRRMVGQIDCRSVGWIVWAAVPPEWGPRVQ